MADASPPKWHLAHTSWFFETFLLKAAWPDYQPFHPRFEYLFNSYYNGIGELYPRTARGALSRPTVAQVMDYRRHVDTQMTALLDEPYRELHDRIELGLHHEQQHQELLLTDVKYNLGNNPLYPAYRPDSASAESIARLGTKPAAATYTDFPGGLIEVGAGGDEFCFDNELPRHQVYLPPFALANRLVCNGEYLEFVEAGGYQEPSLWLSDAWAWLKAEPGIRAPLYWSNVEGEWFEYTLNGRKPLQIQAPVCHVSFYEAEAYARWRGERLPSEQEWEVAVQGVSREDGNLADTGILHPQPAENVSSPQQFYGDVWEWTISAYAPYPGFQPAQGAIGEYNGKFMSNQRVLKGGSCATPAGHIRASYRNFFYPPDRWQFSGIRLARDSGA